MKRQLHKSIAVVVVAALSAHVSVPSVGMQGMFRKVTKAIPKSAARRSSVEGSWRRIAPIVASQFPMLRLRTMDAPGTGRGDLGLNGPELRRGEP